MNRRRYYLFLAAILVTALVVFSARRAVSPAPTTAQIPRPKVNRELGKPVSPPATPDEAASSPKLEPDPAALVAFKKWAEIYAAASPENKRELSTEGLVLAAARGQAMATLIRQNPQAAIQELLPYSLRKPLPPEIASRIEHRISGVGDLMVVAVTPLPGDVVEEPIYRTASLKNESYRAYVYGTRRHDISRVKTRILGVAVTPLTGDAVVAVRENAYEVLDPAEAADLDPNREPTDCPVSESPTASRNDETAIDIGTKILWLCSGGHFTQWLTTPDGQLVAAAGGSGSSSGTSPVMPATYTQGHKKLLVMRVRFADQPVGFEPATDATLQTELQTVVDSLPKWSYGKMTANFAFTPTLDLPGTEASYATSGMDLIGITEAVAAAYTDAAGNRPYVGANFDFNAVVFKASWGDYGGVGFVGSKGTMIKSVAAGVFLHEWGHNFGLFHANFWEPKTNSPISDGTHYEYGNDRSTMGSSGQLGSYTTQERFRIRWLEEGQAPSVTTSGTYRIYNADNLSLTAGRNYALRVQKHGFTYFAEYRPNWNSSTTAFATDNGAMLLWQQDCELLDMTPLTSAGKSDASLLIGRSFHDPEHPLTVTTVGRGGVSPNDYLDVMVNFNNPLTNSPPVAIVTASNSTPAVNAAISLAAFATDPDGDALAYSWDFGDGSNPSVNNSTTQTKSWSTAGEYQVQCTVSDMKGKTFVRSLSIRVGNPATFTISGRVTQGDGNPLQNVAIKDTTNRLTLTDADGRYRFGALSAGSYTLSAICDQRQVTAQTQSQVNIGPSAVNVNFTMSMPSEGGITLERWSGINGNAITNLTSHPSYITTPTLSTLITRSFDAPRNLEDNYGQRASGYFLPPASGAYTFYLATDDDSRLSLSTNDQAANKRMIASIVGDCDPDDWKKYSSQKSAAITLVAGQRYYIEALHKEGIGRDHLLVGVDFPDGTQHRPVEASYFRPLPSSISVPPVPANTVTVATTDSIAREGLGNSGAFTVTRSGSTASPLTVCYGLIGTSAYSTDYLATGLSVIIPAGAASATVMIEPIDDTTSELDESVIFQLAPAATYALGAATQGTVTLQDNEMPQVSVVATRLAISENGDEVGLFTFTRTNQLSSAITVNLTISGTATNGTDYPSLPSTVTIPAGQLSTTVTIVATADGLTEPEETIILGLSPGTGYVTDGPLTATCYILAEPPAVSWKLAGNGSWSDRTKWLTDCPLPRGSLLYALNFNVTGASYSSQNDLGSNYYLNQLNFSGATVSLTGDSLAPVANRNGSPTLNQNGGNGVSISNEIILNSALTLGGNGNGNISLSGIISGSGGINKTHSGRLYLSGMNTYTGGTIVKRGSVEISVPQQSALGMGMITLENGTALNLNRNTMPNELVLKAGTLSATNGFGDRWLGHITLQDVSTINLANTGNFYIEGNINGTGGLRKIGTSSRALTLSGLATYTGPTTVAEGTLTCSRPEALGQGTLRINSGAKLNLEFSGTRQVSALQLNSTTLLAEGIYGSVASGATNQNDSYFSGTGTITVGPLSATPFAAWVATQALTGPTNITPMADPDGDGICNLLEFTLGSNAAQVSVSAVPQLNFNNSGNALFEYDRSDASLSSVTTVVEYGSDLNGWTVIQIPLISSSQVTITDGPTKDHVAVKIPLAGERIFARMRVSQ